MAHKQYDDRLELLLSTAADVFAANGYHSTAMRDLARATGMSLAGMYHYVSGKDELLYLIQQRCFTAVLEGAQRAVGEEADADARLRAFIAHHVTFFTRHMSEMKVLSHEADSVSDARVAGVKTLKRRYVALLVRLIEGVTPRRAEIDPNVAAYALFGMMNWVYHWYDPSGSVTPDRLARQFSDLFLDGLTQPAQTAVAHGA